MTDTFKIGNPHGKDVHSIFLRRGCNGAISGLSPLLTGVYSCLSPPSIVDRDIRAMSFPAVTDLASEGSAPPSQSRSRSPLSWARPSDETVEDIVNNTKAVLETGKDFLDLAPVPGLAASIGAVISVLEQVKVSFMVF